jgi:hypothetical protein
LKKRPKQDEFSEDSEFLAAYHNAKLAEFAYISEAETNVDTKSSAILAADVAVLAIILAFNTASIIILLAIFCICISIGIALKNTWVTMHQGPMANVSFREDIKKDNEIKTLRQIIEDTDSSLNENLNELKAKARLFKWQVRLLVMAGGLLVLQWFIVNYLRSCF